MNVAKLLAVKRQILKVPSQFGMTRYFFTDVNHFNNKYELKREKIPNCGTAGCIAGWAVALEEFQGSPAEAYKAYSRSPHRRAQFLLDLTEIEAERLFYLTPSAHESWPPQFREAYQAAKRLRDRARVAARRIDHFIKTGGRE